MANAIRHNVGYGCNARYTRLRAAYNHNWGCIIFANVTFISPDGIFPSFTVHVRGAGESFEAAGFDFDREVAANLWGAVHAASCLATYHDDCVDKE